MFGVVFYLFTYCLLVLHRSVRGAIGHSFWSLYGLLFSWMRQHCIMFSRPHEVPALLRGLVALGPVFVDMVGFCMLWGCVIYVRVIVYHSIGACCCFVVLGIRIAPPRGLCSCVMSVLCA